MAILTITGDDTIVLNGRVFNDFATADTSVITLPNELVNMKTGKNGNSIIARNMQGYNGNLTLRLSRASSDDQFLAAQLAAMQQNFVGTTLIAGSFTKKLGDGAGNITNDVYDLNGGVISKIPEGKENVDGDVTQAEVVYVIKFTNVTRNIE